MQKVFLLILTSVLFSNFEKEIKKLAYLIKETVKYKGELKFDKSKIDGMKFDIISNYWKLSEDKPINYIAEFRKI